MIPLATVSGPAANKRLDLLCITAVRTRVASMPSRFGWERSVGRRGRVLRLSGLGASAPLRELLKEFGFTWERDPYTLAPAGGETGLAVTARALPALLEIVTAHPDQNVLVVSHKATVRLLVSALLGLDPRLYRDHLDQSPAALNIIDFKDSVHARLTLFNDTSHSAEAGLAIPAPPCADLSKWWDAGDQK